MRGIRFKPDMIKWIQEGIKTTTFRKTRRNGEYEIVKGSWFKPIGLGIYVECHSLMKITRDMLINHYYMKEGDFSSPTSFIYWLKQNKLLKKLPLRGWLNSVEHIKNV